MLSPQARHVEVVEELEVAAERLWALLGDFAGIDRWAALTVLGVEGSGPGCCRTVLMPSGQQVIERLLSHDDAQRSFSYEVVPPNPYGIEAYRSAVQVDVVATHHCRVRWTGEFLQDDDALAARTDHLLRKAYRGGLALLRQQLRG